MASTATDFSGFERKERVSNIYTMQNLPPPPSNPKQKRGSVELAEKQTPAVQCRVRIIAENMDVKKAILFPPSCLVSEAIQIVAEKANLGATVDLSQYILTETKKGTRLERDFALYDYNLNNSSLLRFCKKSFAPLLCVYEKTGVKDEIWVDFEEPAKKTIEKAQRLLCLSKEMTLCKEGKTYLEPLLSLSSQGIQKGEKLMVVKKTAKRSSRGSKRRSFRNSLKRKSVVKKNGVDAKEESKKEEKMFPWGRVKNRGLVWKSNLRKKYADESGASWELMAFVVFCDYLLLYKTGQKEDSTLPLAMVQLAYVDRATVVPFETVAPAALAPVLHLYENSLVVYEKDNEEKKLLIKCEDKKEMRAYMEVLHLRIDKLNKAAAYLEKTSRSLGVENLLSSLAVQYSKTRKKKK